ncbi:hypothetical protein AgCh_000778 [Apium graveolens]
MIVTKEPCALKDELASLDLAEMDNTVQTIFQLRPGLLFYNLNLSASAYIDSLLSLEIGASIVEAGALAYKELKDSRELVEAKDKETIELCSGLSNKETALSRLNMLGFEHINATEIVIKNVKKTEFLKPTAGSMRKNKHLIRRSDCLP